MGVERLPKACICNQKKHPLFGLGVEGREWMRDLPPG